ncbi:histidine ammonia-lyase [Rhizobium sp. LjRoot98]|uniref:HAL/PAL/TAL family ammonia-lyase n=1 Tax=unclassified Rhizobium TaxID=2613769 RepID=UPI0007142E54|nr:MULTISPECIES: histidine ammonia-lyase [unclassified Rhizobium]KQV39036.1 histidine ammonia-lyase [Rhizobium sp. Root1204]KQY16065.1 histidine ammonia-lyase [Rhizobium sp. Root1334]KRC10240.1 histidine ammonia-lyase [Rhizobium sp. Root73]
MQDIVLESALDWRAVAAVASGATLTLSDAARQRVETASHIVSAIVESGVRAYGVNTGVGALADTVVDRPSQSRLSRNIILSHACGVGPRLEAREVRAIIAAQIANFSHGHSGVRPAIVELLQTFLREDCIPEVPSKGSAGYLSHNAHIALVLIGEGKARLKGNMVTGAEALKTLGVAPLVLQAKEGLSLVNGTACSVGLGAVALQRAEQLLDWADSIAALTIEALGCQMAAFDADVLALRKSAGIEKVGRTLRERLAGSGLIEAAQGVRTQDALSLRSVPHAHGAGWDVFDFASAVVNQELASVTDNPAVSGTPEAPVVSSEAHAVAPALGQALDSLAIAIAQISMMSERRIDRLVNPLVSGLPAFLAADPGAGSGFMIAQYTAAALAAENRRLGAPASLDGGITSALQEDFLGHPTAAANKLLAVIDNAEQIFGIEFAAAAQAQDFKTGVASRAAGTDLLYRHIRADVPTYADDRPLGWDLEKARDLLRRPLPPHT